MSALLLLPGLLEGTIGVEVLLAGGGGQETVGGAHAPGPRVIGA